MLRLSSWNLMESVFYGVLQQNSECLDQTLGHPRILLRAQELPMPRAETEFGVARRTAGVKRSETKDVRGKTVRYITPTRYSNYGIIAGIDIRSPSQVRNMKGATHGVWDCGYGSSRRQHGQGENILWGITSKRGCGSRNTKPRLWIL